MMNTKNPEADELWTPAKLGSSLALWLDADDASTITLNGTKVSQWDDKSGNGNHAAQAVAANQPARVTNGIQFDGTDDYMDITAANIKTVTQPFVYAMVVNLDSAASFKPTIDGITNSLDRIITGNEGLAKNDGMFSGTAINALTQVTATAVRVYNFASPSSSYFRNGISVVSGDSGAQNPSSGIRLGADHDLSGPNYSNILFNEYVVIDGVLSTDDRQKLEGYLAHKWGLTDNLPVEHPYKITPPYAGKPVYDADAQAYFNRVEGPSGDNQTLETAVKTAINDFVVGCKDDGIWGAIKASCIMAGARTLAGALQPLVGTAPTNFNFVSGDYDRKTGLIGDGAAKYLNSNRANNADPQDNAHVSCYITAISPGTGCYLGAIQIANEGFSGILRNGNTGLILQTRGAGDSIPVINSHLTTGFKGATRSNGTQMTRRFDDTTATVDYASTVTTNNNYFILALNTGTSQVAFSNGRISFYSIGESLNLAALDTRVSTLMTALDGAIA
jgi:hypothetical protein